MFRRRAFLDRDASAVAQRRLAALAAHLGSEQGSTGGRDGGLGGSPAVGLVEAEPAATPPRTPDPALSLPPGRARGRHAARGQPRDLGRWELTPHHVTVAALLVLALVAVTAWWVMRSDPEPQPVQLASERTPPSAPASTTQPSAMGAPASATPVAGAPPSPGTDGLLVVDVAGRVRNAGIVELPSGSRVVDALEAAGGARPGVSTATLNLARPLVDGEQIVVGARAAPGSGTPPGAGALPGTAASTATVAPVNLNTADLAQLDTLPGVGPVTAEAILTWRTENGRFTSVDELLEISGIGDVTFSELEPLVYV